MNGRPMADNPFAFILVPGMQPMLASQIWHKPLAELQMLTGNWAVMVGDMRDMTGMDIPHRFTAWWHYEGHSGTARPHSVVQVAGNFGLQHEDVLPWEGLAAQLPPAAPMAQRIFFAAKLAALLARDV